MSVCGHRGDSLDERWLPTCGSNNTSSERFKREGMLSSKQHWIDMASQVSFDSAGLSAPRRSCQGW